MLDRVLDKIIIIKKKKKKIIMMTGIEKFDNSKILIDKDNKLADEVTLKNVVALIS